jgi:hypothetical protein
MALFRKISIKGCHLSLTNPHFSPGGEMIAQGFGLMKYILVFHPFAVAQRSRSVPDGFITEGFLKERNTDCISD